MESSLSYRAGRSVFLWLATAGRASLVGRFFAALAQVLACVGGDSVVFGLGHAGSRSLERHGHAGSVLALSRAYHWLRRYLPRLPQNWSAVAFSRGAWSVVVGAGVAGLGCGCLVSLAAGGVATTVSEEVLPTTFSLGLALAVLLVAIGAVLLVAGTGLRQALAGSLAGCGGRGVAALVEGGSVTRTGGADVRAGDRGAAGHGGPQSWRSISPLTWAGGVLALVAGVVTGLAPSSESLIIVAAVVALCLLVVLLWRPEVLLLAVAVFPWLDWLARGNLGSLGPAWDDALLVVSVALLLWAVLVQRRSQLWTVSILLPALLAFAAAVGSVVVREVPSVVAVFALRVLFQPLLFFFIGFLFPKNKRWVQWIIALFLLAGLALALHGLFQYVTDAPMPKSWVDVRETDISTRAYSIIENPNGLGAFLLMGGLISLSLALGRGLPRIQRGLMGVVCVIHLAGIAVTFSRGAWLGLIAGVVALFILAYRRYLAPLVAVGVVGWFAAPARFTNRLMFAFSAEYITKSMAAGRLYVWKMAVGHALSHPFFGLGLGTFGGTAAVRFGYGRLWVDNFYLQLAAEGGIILLVFFLWILLRAAKGLVKAHLETPDPCLRLLAAGMFGAFVAVAVANATASVWETLVVGVGFWFLTGLVTSAVLHARSSEQEESGGALAPTPSAWSAEGRPDRAEGSRP